MYGMRKLFKSFFLLFLVFLLSSSSSSSWALEPQDALSARSAKSIYLSFRLDNLNGLLQKIFSPANIEMVASVASPERAQAIRLIGSFASQIPARSVAFAAGSAENGEPFLQIAASMPPQVRPKLDLIAKGTAKGEDIVTLLLGDAALMFSGGFKPEVAEGSKGPYYVLGGGAVFAAKDDLFLAASSPAELDAALDAAADTEKRLTLKRRFKSPDYYLTHIDMSLLPELEKKFGGRPDTSPEIDMKAVLSYFKAPLDMEAGFDAKPESFLMSAAVNLLEAMPIFAERFKDLSPTPGGNVFFAGGGKLFLAFSNPMFFDAEDWKVYPEFYKVWNEGIKELAKRGIAEKDVLNLLRGSFSVAVGNEATFLGRKTPGAYVTLRGQDGAAARILARIVEDEQISQTLPLAPLKAEGWDSLYRLDPTLTPVSVVIGVAADKNTLFLGAADPEAISKKPTLPAEGEKLFSQSLIGGGFIDLAGAWEWLRQDTSSPLWTYIGVNPNGDEEANGNEEAQEAAAVLRDVLDAELSVPFVKLWSSALETAFLEYTLADVPSEKSLLYKVLKLISALDSLAPVVSAASTEYSNILSDLSNMKAASMMFYSDHKDEVSKLPENTNLIERLKPYFDNPEKYNENAYIFVLLTINGEQRWLVGYNLEKTPAEVKTKLAEKTRSSGLVNGEGEPYTAADAFVFRIAR
ncbi:MAG: hypothetical protein LBC93_00810 [Synergistaceae bacterium]|jgi:hypothetical protein|nr:hypothetical protein [Synergistaceae bacterium]